MNRPVILSESGNLQRLPQAAYLTGNLVAVKANCVVQSFATATLTRILFNNVSIDTNNHWNASVPGEVKCQIPGLYHVCGAIQLPNNTATDALLQIRVNGNITARSQFKNSSVMSFEVSDIYNLVTNDILELWFYHGQSSSLSLTHAKLYMFRVGQL